MKSSGKIANNENQPEINSENSRGVRSIKPHESFLAKKVAIVCAGFAVVILGIFLDVSHGQQKAIAQQELSEKIKRLEREKISILEEMKQKELELEKLKKAQHALPAYAENYPDKLKNQLRLAMQGNAKAQLSVGTAYMNGDGVAQDKSEAVKWFRKAAEQGLDGAQASLGLAYDYGDGITEDRVQALKWYRKSADQEFALGQYMLGLFHLFGRGGSKDRQAAIFWLKKAAAQNNQLAKDKLRELGETP